MGRGSKRPYTIYRDNDDIHHPEIPQARMLKASKDGQRIWPTPRSPQKKPTSRSTQTRLDDFEIFGGNRWAEYDLGDFGEDDIEGDALTTAEAEVVVVEVQRVAKRYPTSVSNYLLFFYDFCR